jgi:hypothetical protein
MRLPKVDPKTGSLLKTPRDLVNDKNEWQEGLWNRIEWWDDDSPPS